MLSVLIGLVAVFLIYVQATYRQKYTVQVQEKGPLHASQDSAEIAPGRYLVMSPAHCTSCHVPAEMQKRVEQGEELPLIGGYEWHLPIGIIRSANITPDPATGHISKWSEEVFINRFRGGVRNLKKATCLGAPSPLCPTAT